MSSVFFWALPVWRNAVHNDDMLKFDFLLRTCLNSPHMWIIPTSHPIGFPQPDFKFCGAILAEEQVQRCKYKLCSQDTKNIVQSGLLTSTAICCKLWMLKFSDPGKCAFWHFEIILHSASCSKQAFFALKINSPRAKVATLTGIAHPPEIMAEAIWEHCGFSDVAAQRHIAGVPTGARKKSSDF